MSDYEIDIEQLVVPTAAALTSALTGRTKQQGFETTYNRIGQQDDAGVLWWFWPRINGNIVVKDNFLSNDGGDEGVRVTDGGSVGLTGTDSQSGSYVHGSAGNYRFMLLDENGDIVVGTADVAIGVT